MEVESKLQAPVAQSWVNIMGVLCVYDMDLSTMDECSKSSYDICEDSQGVLTAWSKLLIATGGMLKPEKCFYYMVYYKCQDDDSWTYTDMVDDCKLFATQSNGSTTPI